MLDRQADIKNNSKRKKLYFYHEYSPSTLFLEVSIPKGLYYFRNVFCLEIIPLGLYAVAHPLSYVFHKQLLLPIGFSVQSVVTLLVDLLKRTTLLELEVG